MKRETHTTTESTGSIPSCTDQTILRVTDEQTQIVGAFVPHPLFTRRDAQREVFGENGFSVEVTLDHPRSRLTHAQCQLLFLQYNYCRFRLVQAIIARQSQADSRKSTEEMMMWHRASLARRDRLVECNLGLVAMMIRNVRSETADYDELVSEGNLTLLYAVDKFDVNRGFRFSTYACQAIQHAFSQVMSHRQRRSISSFSDSQIAELAAESDNADPCHEESRLVRAIVNRNDAMLTDVEVRVIRSRFAFPAPMAIPPMGSPMTRKEIGELIGVSKERVRQIEKYALSKLRMVLVHRCDQEAISA